MALVAILGGVMALRRARESAGRRDLAFGVAGAVALAAAITVTEVPGAWTYAVVLLVAAVGIGLLMAKMRAPLAWLTSLSIVFAVIMALFGGSGAVAVGFGVMGFGVGLPLGQGLRGLLARGARGDGKSQHALAVEP